MKRLARSGLQVQVARARTIGEIDAAPAAFAREPPDVLFVGTDPFFTGRRVQLANWASGQAIPMTSGTREITDVGGLMSYGANIPDAWRQIRMRDVSLRARNPATFRSCRRRSWSWSSMSRPPGYLALLFRHHYSRPPMR